MPANVALTATEETRLASTNHLVDAYLSYIPDTEIGHATVDSAFVAAYPVVEIPVTSASADWDTAYAGQTVKITNAAGTVLRGYYRMRIAPTNTTLYIEEIGSDGDGGIVAFSNRTATITIGDLCTALARRDLTVMKPYVASGVIYQDFNTSVGTYNQEPEVIVNCAINGLPGDYVTQVAAGATKAISAVVTVTPWSPSIDATYSYVWTYPASFTGVAGAATATLTATAPVGSHFIRCEVTPSVGLAFQIERWVRIHDPNDPPLNVKVGIRDNSTKVAREITVTAKQSVLSVIPAGAYCVIWGTPLWGGLDVATAAHTFQGYSVSQPFMHRPAWHESSLRIVGPCGLLQMLESYAASFTYTGTTSSWENLDSDLSTIQYVMYWVLRWRVSNVLIRHNFTPLTTGNLSGRAISITVDPGKVYDQLKALADKLDANIGSRSDGEIICVAEPSLMDTTLRSALTTRTTLTNSIYKSISVEWNRRVDKSPLVLKGTMSTLAEPADVQIASAAPFDTSSSRQVNNLVFESQDDANRRSGKHYARATSEYGMVRIELPGNYDVFEPVDRQRVSVVVPATRSPTQSQITLTCIPESVSRTLLGGKRASITLECTVETDGMDGVTKVVPASDTELYGPNSNPFDTPLITPPATWGDEDSRVPFALLLATQDGYVIAVDSP